MLHISTLLLNRLLGIMVYAKPLDAYNKFDIVSQPWSLLLALLFSAAVCQPSWIPDPRAAHRECLLSCFLSCICVEHNTWPLSCDTVDPEDLPNILFRWTWSNVPWCLYREWLAHTHLHCFGEAGMMLWHLLPPVEPHEPTDTAIARTALPVYPHIDLFSLGVWNIKNLINQIIFSMTHSHHTLYCVSV